MLKLQLGKELTKYIMRGGQWVYSDALVKPPSGKFAQHGKSAILLSGSNQQPIAWGFYDAFSPIGFRVLSPLKHYSPTSEQNWSELIQKTTKQKLERAIDFRLKALFPNNQQPQIQLPPQFQTQQTNTNSFITNGYRIVNGEGDFCPGMTIDRYNNVAVVRFDGSASAQFWTENVDLVSLIREKFPELVCIYHKKLKPTSTQSQQIQQQQQHLPQEIQKFENSHPFWGSLPSEIEFKENGVKFHVDVEKGQKSGFFLDMRENRMRIAQLAKGKHVLNMCSYTGGFSVYAGLGGAKSVTSVDISEGALEDSKRNWRLNGLPDDKHETIVADMFEFLQNQKNRQRTKHQHWDLIIVDPPSMAPSEKKKEMGLNAYFRLATLASSLIEPNGILALGSCSSHVNMSEFRNTCESAISDVSKRLPSCFGSYQNSQDHPTAIGTYDYLKFLLYKMMD